MYVIQSKLNHQTIILNTNEQKNNFIIIQKKKYK